jgi:uncharacterized RDD family membrane protein YckC
LTGGPRPDKVARVSAERLYTPARLTRRRLRAYGIDLAVMAGWQGVLAAGAVLLPGRQARARVFRAPATADLAQFVTGVLPAAVYLASGESGPARATAGKRSARLVVAAEDGGRAGAGRIAVRTAVKLLPWQLAHLGVARVGGAVPGRHAERTARAALGAALTLTAVSCTLAVCRADGRALHDLAAGTRVVAADEREDPRN